MNWIANHASKLRRVGSKLEFFVRQEQVKQLYDTRMTEFIVFVSRLCWKYSGGSSLCSRTYGTTGS